MKEKHGYVNKKVKFASPIGESCVKNENQQIRELLDSNSSNDESRRKEQQTVSNPKENEDVTSIPQIPCSKYTIIGDPSLRKRRAMRRRESKAGARRWTVPGNDEVRFGHAGIAVNVLDQGTMYNAQQKARYQDSTANAIIKTPMESSDRMRELHFDTERLREKVLVMRDFLHTGRMRIHERDRGFIPTVYPDYFSTNTSKKNYINAWFSEDYSRRNSVKTDCSRGPQDRDTRMACRCQYCDVLGRKYCSFCIEFQNRHFAKCFEGDVLPTIPLPQERTSLIGSLLKPRLVGQMLDVIQYPANVEKLKRDRRIKRSPRKDRKPRT